jgi:hypothetical protein
MKHVNSEFVSECPSYLLAYYFNDDRGNPPTLWSICVVASVSLCCSLAHGFGLCGALGTTYCMLDLSSLLRTKKARTHLWVGSFHDPEGLWVLERR